MARTRKKPRSKLEREQLYQKSKTMSADKFKEEMECIDCATKSEREDNFKLIKKNISSQQSTGQDMFRDRDIPSPQPHPQSQPPTSSSEPQDRGNWFKGSTGYGSKAAASVPQKEPVDDSRWDDEEFEEVKDFEKKFEWEPIPPLDKIITHEEIEGEVQKYVETTEDWWDSWNNEMDDIFES